MESEQVWIWMQTMRDNRIFRVSGKRAVSGCKNGLNRYVFALVLVVLIGCKKPTDTKPDVVDIYSIMIGNKEIDQTEAISYDLHEKLNHRVTIYINDNPIHSTIESGILVINPFIKPGENVVKIRSEETQHIEVMATIGTSDLTVKERNYFQHDFNEQNNSFEYTFSAGIKHVYPIYKPENQLSTVTNRDHSLPLELVKSIISLSENRRFDDAASLIIEGPRYWLPYSEKNYSPEWIQAFKKNFSSLCTSGGYHFQSYDSDEYIVEYGKSLILIYRKDGGNAIFSSKYRNAPTTAAYIDGKYILWSCDPL